MNSSRKRTKAQASKMQNKQNKGLTKEEIKPELETDLSQYLPEKLMAQIKMINEIKLLPEMTLKNDKSEAEKQSLRTK